MRVRSVVPPGDEVAGGPARTQLAARWTFSSKDVSLSLVLMPLRRAIGEFDSRAPSSGVVVEPAALEPSVLSQALHLDLVRDHLLLRRQRLALHRAAAVPLQEVVFAFLVGQPFDDPFLGALSLLQKSLPLELAVLLGSRKFSVWSAGRHALGPSRLW